MLQMDETNNVKVSFLRKGIAVVLILFLIPADYILKNAVLGVSNDFIIQIQRLRSNSLDDFFTFINYVGSNLTLVIIPPAIYNLYDVRRAVKQIFVNCFGMYVYSIIALLTKEPRPYWVDSNIKGISCEDGYASPFLELFLAAVLYSSYSIEIFHSKENKYKATAYTITAIFVILIAFGGIYLGLNYPHQIFVTYCYTYVYVTIIFDLDEEIMKISMLSCFNYKVNRKYMIHWFIATLFLLTGVVSVYVIITLDDNVSISWIKNAYKDCNRNQNIGGGPNFQKSGWIFYNLGMVDGCMLCSKHLSMTWWNTPYWKRLVRSTISIGLSLGIFFLFRKLYLEIIPAANNTTEYTFQIAIPYFFMAYCVFGLLPIGFSRINLALDLKPIHGESSESSSELINNIQF